VSQSRQRLDTLTAEHARKADLTVPEREEEHYEAACRLAAVRGNPPPDREVHRQAFYERSGYRPGPDLGEAES
jgi:hypothetical protein